MSALAETRHGILQYFPDEPCEGDSLAWYGEWLEPHLTLLASLVQPGRSCSNWDRVSALTRFALRNFRAPADTSSLREPRATVARVLRQNLAANRVANATVLRNPVTTVDALCLDRLDWLKAAEASEAHAVVQGSTGTLWRLRPRLWIAVADDAQMRSLSAELAGFGYRCWRIATPLHNADNFNGRPDDLFGGREALALVAVPEESDPGMVLASCAELSLN